MKSSVAASERVKKRAQREEIRKVESRQMVSGSVGQKKELEFYSTFNEKSFEV